MATGGGVNLVRGEEEENKEIHLKYHFIPTIIRGKGGALILLILPQSSFRPTVGQVQPHSLLGLPRWTPSHGDRDDSVDQAMEIQTLRIGQWNLLLMVVVTVDIWSVMTVRANA